jgi:hypothetical protein
MPAGVVAESSGCRQGRVPECTGFALGIGASHYTILGRIPMMSMMNELLTPKKIKVALLVLATFAAMC